ncbi:UDP-N-acetylmuramoyl-L-alanyl-D-glutamate:meso-diaminopimelate ligase [Wigglesworthia glossinidia endosymbiont of Glossina morsitans morsitans (Yale colony)]|uniref:UDP-N-acetylmuramoyl-L-alanyl-D-glutamate--2,6-diaminopimelate ligase n=1 Tax=Wigglesworthia glossinidia endosymbiont of Glossina morsitans morsitans (Yale colony) TaxID=1142511 RepID=H6Q5A5_WIGGL|nr:UDP-N-acetylmuramoyl-L-alanyl-D-glutamate--2,6-diaminopimelate ligase [Wigglesworthia glossinidia]AFA41388.1 UDP-N-acetylmuramoyl-L-alanyl-D-glutamate:meso-diaminopimelate ligase [Wigglesworthia glossinidia endosymbiont of Glossina morsitans morsitans (Yale colony)]
MVNYIDLKKLIFPWVSSKEIPSIKLDNLTLNSKKVTQNTLFIAISGNKQHGKKFIFEAIQNGSTAILVETNNMRKHGKMYYVNTIPIIYFYQLNRHLSELSGKFYYHPSKYMQLIGITGTNGKTTVAYFITQWLNFLGKKSGIMGTLGYGQINKLHKSENTTYSAIKCQKVLKNFLKKNIRIISMEVSSHGLSQDRVNYLYFTIAVFTNLSHEHLDYHKNMIQYENSKWKLFSELSVSKYIINIDDNVGKNWAKKFPQAIIVSTKYNLSKKFKNLKIYVKKIFFHCYGTKITIVSSWGTEIVNVKLFGKFNINNLLIACAVLLIQGHSFTRILNYIEKIHMPQGRMEIFYLKKLPKIIIDYAHTPDALEKLLITIKLHFKTDMYVIFGCGGNRDREKRAIMGKICEKYAKNIIITNDNPRYENEEQIFSDIKIGIKNFNNVKFIPSRKKAIKFAVQNSNKKDIVMILGKGHEEYQQFYSQKYFYSDKIVVKEILKKII